MSEDVRTRAPKFLEREKACTGSRLVKDQMLEIIRLDALIEAIKKSGDGHE